MAQMKYSEKIETLWENSPYCNCGRQDCHLNSHRLCNICYGTIFYGAHESVENQQNSIGAWNTDHIIAKSNGGGNSISNLQAVHIYCNRDKADQQ
jgi:5-methylcytosine-specific restriction endonuclease McrA